MLGQNFRCRGFTLVELVAVITIIGLIGAIAVPRFVSLTEEAQLAQISGVLAALRSGQVQVMAQFRVQGSPGDGVAGNRTVIVDGIPVRFNNGQIRTALNSNQVPTVLQNRNAAYTRLFFLFLRAAPSEIVLRNSSASGWAMLGNNASCAAGPNPRRCWEYGSASTRVARITYFATTGKFIQD